MLNEALKVAYAQQVQAQERDELVALMKQLPIEELRKIAQTGEIKLAFLNCAPDGGPQSWLDQFKGTPFMEQAIALEQELLQADMANQQRNQVESDQSRQSWAAMDQIRMKKRLLELQKAKADMGTLTQAGVPTSGNLPPPDQAPQAAVQPPAVDTPKTASPDFRRADAMGRALARADMEKAAAQRMLLAAGDRAGRALVKMGGLGNAVLNLAKNNPGMVIGGTLGAAHGLLKQDGGIGDAIAEGTMGAAAGHAVGGVGKRIARGQTVGESLKGYGTQVGREAKVVSGRLMEAKMPEEAVKGVVPPAN